VVGTGVDPVTFRFSERKLRPMLGSGRVGDSDTGFSACTALEAVRDSCAARVRRCGDFPCWVLP
jgi:hypothetical protein